MRIRGRRTSVVFCPSPKRVIWSTLTCFNIEMVFTKWFISTNVDKSLGRLTLHVFCCRWMALNMNQSPKHILVRSGHRLVETEQPLKVLVLWM